MRVVPATSEQESKSLDSDEIARFEAMAEQWWSPTGKFKALHKFNPVRLSYIREQLGAHFNLDLSQDQPLKGLRILDIGCGGGLLSEPIARLGADVVGADPGRANIETAKIHAKASGLTIDYRCNSAEELANAGEEFDVVLNMEVIEHVLDVQSFMQACCKMVKPNGLHFVATLNRTQKSYLLAILGAEYILRWLPKGTHDWKKFLKPDEIKVFFNENNLIEKQRIGVTYSPFLDKWNLASDMSVNYMMLANRSAKV